MDSSFNFQDNPQGNFQANFQGECQGDFQGDLQGLEQGILGGTNVSMQPMVPHDNIDWSQWMDFDAMGTGLGPGVMADWGPGR